MYNLHNIAPTAQDDKRERAEKGKACIAPAINRAEIQHLPARRTIQGARARLDRQSAPRKCKREKGRHEINNEKPLRKGGEFFIDHLTGKYPTIEYLTFIPVLGIFVSCPLNSE